MEPPCPPDPSLSTDSRHRIDTEFKPHYLGASLSQPLHFPPTQVGGGPIFYMCGWPPTQHHVLPQRIAQTRLLPQIPLDHFDNKRKNVHYQKKPTVSGCQKMNHTKNRNGSHTGLAGFHVRSRLCDLGRVILPPRAWASPSVRAPAQRDSVTHARRPVSGRGRTAHVAHDGTCAAGPERCSCHSSWVVQGRGCLPGALSQYGSKGPGKLQFTSFRRWFREGVQGS